MTRQECFDAGIAVAIHAANVFAETEEVQHLSGPAAVLAFAAKLRADGVPDEPSEAQRGERG